jgi:outer membrane protein assembly factor BamB
VVAFDPRTGATRWRASVDGPVDVPPALGHGRVVVYSGGRKPAVQALDVRSGSTRWRRRLAGPTGGAAIVAARGGPPTVVAASLGGELATFDLPDGTRRWKARARTPALAEPLAMDSVLFVSTLSDSLARFRSADGRRLASIPAGAACPSGLVRSGDRAYGLTSAGDLIAVDPGGGLLFRTAIGGPATGAPAVSGDTIYAATSAGAVAAVRARDGGILWRRSFPQTYAASPVPGLGLLWVGALSGEVRGLDPATGEDRARFRRDGTIRWLHRTGHGALLIGLEGGKVTAVVRPSDPRKEATPG